MTLTKNPLVEVKHKCGAADRYAVAVERVRALGRAATNQVFAYGEIADPECVSVVASPLRMGLLDNAEYCGPIFYCPWCGEHLGDAEAA
jgi:hypothetical protein